MQGASLAPAFAGKEAAVRPLLRGNSVFRRSIWAGPSFVPYGRTAGSISARRNPSFTTWSQDPGETSNVIASHPAEVQELEAKLKSVIGGAGRPRRRSRPRWWTADHRPIELSRLPGRGFAREYELTGKGIDPKDRVEVLKLLHLAVSPDSGAPSSRRIPTAAPGARGRSDEPDHLLSSRTGICEADVQTKR